MNRAIDRFGEYMQLKNLNDNRVTVELGIAVGTISKSRAEGRDLSAKVIAKILAHYSDIREDWLLLGKGEMLKNNCTSEVDIEEKQCAFLPLIPLRTAAGFLCGEVNLVDCEQYTIPFFYKIGADFLIEVIGDSMMPKFQNGDIVACKKLIDNTHIQWGHVYVIDSSIGIIMKVVNKSSNNDIVMCHSFNENYADFELELTAIRSLAMVVGTMSSYV